MPTNDLRQLPAALPWDAPAYLLLDGISVETLPQQLYEWSESPDFDAVYLETPWAELAEVSPCLVRLNGQQDPALAAFVQNSQDEWGYLVFSPASRDEVLNHLRWLVSVRHPLGEAMLLRLADPAVIYALLEPTLRDADATLWGPVEQIVAADRMQNSWHQLQRPGSATAARHDRPYQLSDAQLERLGEVAFRGILIRLDEHLREYFPDYHQALTPPDRWQHLRTLAEQAYAQGFHSEQDITLYANIFGLLGDSALQEHTDIAELLTQKSSLTPSQRIEQAADLAYARAQSAQRISS
ncbi:MAG: DUF4123 domain-containing protein [Gammaproteobacteria bacterium]|nr:DUF4123 domain-containing protein [Gammaproteobacteria bacterium]MBU2067005.1 DUF4123 domain-containing protein [Gammaproteobacteria bacterium]MBU2138956.1 DUF4123 domain-containing protein [Gammaproteobacteria bacterium]MBU2216301.1 DUF4123 domain-containing protein [Gammaproteobacteria bacterium]MBU2322807.1 DUF4123 domain-containing protein [Gammaproteobacteria bacterium]